MHLGLYPGSGGFHLHLCDVPGASTFEFASNGRALQGLTVPVPIEKASPQTRLAVVFFGGSSEDVTGQAMQAQHLLLPIANTTDTVNFQVYVLPYRGYIHNPGWSSQSAITSDAEAVLDAVLRREGEQRIILAGASMGSAVAIQLAARRPDSVAGLMVEAPWSTLWLATGSYWEPWSWSMVPWVWLLDSWDSVGAISSLPSDIVVAVLSPGDDELIPQSQHVEVFQASLATRKWLLIAPGMKHNDLAKIAQLSAAKLTFWAQVASARTSNRSRAASSPQAGKHGVESLLHRTDEQHHIRDELTAIRQHGQQHRWPKNHNDKRQQQK